MQGLLSRGIILQAGLLSRGLKVSIAELVLGEAEGDLEHGQLGDGSARNAARTIQTEVERQRSPGRVETTKNMLLCGCTPGTGDKSFATLPLKGSVHQEKLRNPMPL